MKQTTLSQILVITSCTKDKAVPSHLFPYSLAGTSELWDKREDDRTLRDFGELEKYRTPATELYRGLQHTELMRGVKLLRRTFGQSCIDVKIISAGFGVVDEHQLLPLYEATFADLPGSSITALSQRLRIPQTLNELMSGSYDCAFFLLGEAYLLSLDLPFAFAPSFPCFFLASPKILIPDRHPYYHVPVGKDESVAFRFNQIGLKGHLFRLFAEQLVSPWTKTLVFQSCTTADARLQSFLSTPTPQFFLNAIRPARGSCQKAERAQVVQQSLFPDVVVSASEKR